MKRGGESDELGTLSNSLVTENTNSVLDRRFVVGRRGKQSVKRRRDSRRFVSRNRTILGGVCRM